MLRAAGASIHRIGFNAGDQLAWKHKDAYTPFLEEKTVWREWLTTFLDARQITDIVLYGDTRDIHQTARELARTRNITVHCFEEGYLRPYWITYERGGVNGNSRLMRMTVPEMRAMLGGRTRDVPEAPAQWGALWHHIYNGALYHWQVLFLNGKYKNFKPHRTISVKREWWLYIKRLALFAYHSWDRQRETTRLTNSGANYHLVLLQLAHDASFRDHSDFAKIDEFIDLCIKGFAAGAPKHHRLVFKTHPLEDGREPIPALIRAAAARYGIRDRVQMIRGGKLGEMLDRASSAVTVNSTAGQQVLWRGLPLKAFGRSVYSQPEFVSYQPIDEFFANPRVPDREAYMLYRQFLLETSQFPGGFYTAEGRAQVLRLLTDILLENRDPYDGIGELTATAKPQLAAKIP